MIDIEPLSQRDGKWKNVKLGTSNVTIGDYGCLLTCCTMLANYYGHNVTVPQLNSKFIQSNSYDNGNLYKWYSGLPVVYPDIQLTKLVSTPQPVTASQFSEIDTELKEGRPVILQVDFIPATLKVDMHYVLLIGKDKEYKVADPYYGDVASLSRYGTPKYAIQQYVFHKGNKKQSNIEDLVNQTSVIDGEVAIAIDQLKDVQKRVKELESTLKKLYD